MIWQGVGLRRAAGALALHEPARHQASRAPGSRGKRHRLAWRRACRTPQVHEARGGRGRERTQVCHGMAGPRRPGAVYGAISHGRASRARTAGPDVQALRRIALGTPALLRPPAHCPPCAAACHRRQGGGSGRPAPGSRRPRPRNKSALRLAARRRRAAEGAGGEDRQVQAPAAPSVRGREGSRTECAEYRPACRPSQGAAERGRKGGGRSGCA